MQRRPAGRRPAFSISRARPRRAAGRRPWRARPTGAPWASIPTASITASAPRPSVRSRISSRRRRPPTRRLGAVPARQLEALGDEVDPDHRSTPRVRRDAHAHLADRAEPVDGERSRLRGVGVRDRLPRRRQDVREVEEALVRRALRHLDRAELGLRHAQVLGLPAGHLPVQLRVAEQRRALVVLAHLRRLALRVELLVAHEAVPARDVERHHDPVAGLDCVTSAPTSSTIPIGSWPRMSPSSMYGPSTS